MTRRLRGVLIDGTEGSYRFDDGPAILVRLALDGGETVIGRYEDSGDPFLAAFAACPGRFAAYVQRDVPLSRPRRTTSGH